MDLRLPLLADANLHIGVAEEAAAQGACLTAREQLDKARLALDDLEKAAGSMDDVQGGLFQQMLRPLQERFALVERSLPRAGAVTVLPESERVALQKDLDIINSSNPPVLDEDSSSD